MEQKYPFTLIFSKRNGAAFLSHLDTVRIIERALRRTGLAVLFTSGFNPRIRLSCRNALPVGLATEGEPLTFWLTEDYEPGAVAESLGRQLPVGLDVVTVERGRGRDREAVKDRETSINSKTDTGPDAGESAAGPLFEIRYTGPLAAMESAVAAWRSPGAEPAAEETEKSARVIDPDACLESVDVLEDRLLVRVRRIDGKLPRQSELLKFFRTIPEAADHDLLEIGAITRVSAS